MMHKALLTWYMEKDFLDYLKNNLPENIEIIIPETLSLKELRRLVKDCDILLVGKYDNSLVDYGKNLKFIQSLTASVHRIDIKYAKNKGIKVCSAKGCNAIPVAEHTTMLMLLLTRHATDYLQSTTIEKRPEIYELHEKNICIVGVGNTGKEVAKRCKSMGMKLYGVDKYPIIDNIGFEKISDDLYSLLSIADFLTLHVPLTEKTYHMISKKELSKMKSTAYLINVARGDIVNFDDLDWALENNIIKGAATDVFPKENPDIYHPIFKRKNFLYTPHIAGRSQEAKFRLAKYIAKNIQNYIDNKELLNLVDPEKGF